MKAFLIDKPCQIKASTYLKLLLGAHLELCREWEAIIHMSDDFDEPLDDFEAVSEDQPQYIPKSPFFKKLLELRNQAIDKGMTLLSHEEILREVEGRRWKELED